MFTIKNFPYIEEINEIGDAQLPYAEKITQELQKDLHFFNEAYDFSEKTKEKKSGEKDGFVDARKQSKKKANGPHKKFAAKKTFKKAATKRAVKKTFRKK